MTSLGLRSAMLGGVIGLAALSYHNWRLWQRDKAILEQKAQPTPLPPLKMWQQLPKVSILVAAWNEASAIDRHIESYDQLRYPQKELVLCAGGDDGTYERARRWNVAGLTVIEQLPGEGKQRALRRCLDRSDGQVIFLTDADCILDDASFEGTLYPVVCSTEQVSSGFHQPCPDQVANPFVASQAASLIYGALHGPKYSAGLTGANCAIDRSLLERSEGLDAHAATGTDYVLAKMLTRAGAKIRQIPESRVATEYPDTVPAYIRQQRRWLRNVALHGRRFEANDEVRSSLRTSAVGVGLLMLPAGAVIFGPSLLILWLLLLYHALLSRVRYLCFSSVACGTPFSVKQIALQGPMLLLDFVAWSSPLLDYISPRRRTRW